ncbi:TolC family protein [Gammaproteobacteria bacterium]|nr:TolC family protein [Gammaproteobacteria bacterium]
MEHSVFLRLRSGCMLALLLATAANAADTQTDWRGWLTRQIDMHPDVVAASERLNANLSLADQRDRPIYNPGLLGGYEREGDANNWRVGLGQTFDVNGRRDAQTDQAVALREAARQRFMLAWQDKATQVLRAMVARQAAGQRYELALEQQAQLDDIIELMQQRQLAGDVGQIDVEMTMLSLSRRLNDTALSLAAFQSAEATLHELLLLWDANLAEVPQQFWSLPVVQPPEEWLLNHPAVLAAKGNWQSLQRQAVVADRARKSEPTVILDGGKEGDESVVGLALAIPLRVRNNFDDQVRSANQIALAAKADYRAIQRRLSFDIEAATTVARQYRTQHERWQDVVANSSERSGNLLELQWAEGDLGTNEYLILLQQRIDGLLASIELTENYRLSLLDWLNATGRVRAQLVLADSQSVEE